MLKSNLTLIYNIKEMNETDVNTENLNLQHTEIILNQIKKKIYINN